MELSDKVKNAAKTIAEKHATVLQRKQKAQEGNLELAESIVEELKREGYNTEVITATLTEMGYDEGLMEYLQLTPTQTVGEILAGGVGRSVGGSAQGLPLHPSPHGSSEDVGAPPPDGIPPDAEPTPKPLSGEESETLTRPDEPNTLLSEAKENPETESD